MKALQNVKLVTVDKGVTVATNATAFSSAIDLLGYDECLIIIEPRVETQTTTKFTTLHVYDADATGTSNFAVITGYRGGTATATNVDFVAGTCGTATSSTVVQAIHITRDKTKKRYLRLYMQLSGTGGTNNPLDIYAILSRGLKAPTNTTELNVQSFVGR